MDQEKSCVCICNFPRNFSSKIICFTGNQPADMSVVVRKEIPWLRTLTGVVISPSPQRSPHRWAKKKTIGLLRKGPAAHTNTAEMPIPRRNHGNEAPKAYQRISISSSEGDEVTAHPPKANIYDALRQFSLQCLCPVMQTRKNENS